MCTTLKKSLWLLTLISVLAANLSLAHAQQSTSCIECHQKSHNQPLTSTTDDPHAKAGVSCLDCHTSKTSQSGIEHYNFYLIEINDSSGCQACHKK